MHCPCEAQSSKIAVDLVDVEALASAVIPKLVCHAGHWCMTCYVLDAADTGRRRTGCTLNQVHEVGDHWDDLPPKVKSSQEMYRAAHQADQAMSAPMQPTTFHGVKGSHAFMKLPYWDEAGFRVPDPMHTISNEVRTRCVHLKFVVGHTPHICVCIALC